jgi:hypothetical protein
MKKNKIKIGDLVKVKKGIFAPDQEGICIEGWQGRVFEKTEDKDGTPLISIEWDSITLENMPESYIEQGENENLNNSIMTLDIEEVELVEAIDKKEDAKDMSFTGKWHIYEMEQWDEDYFNMDVQAYIEIKPDNRGFFQFGMVSGDMDGRIIDYSDVKRFDFTWDGNDECDHASGSGWVIIKKKDMIEGEFRVHNSDSSTFLARRAKG